MHITSILSKTVERVIGEPLVRFLEAKGYGNEQWAFRKKSSARDLVTLYVAKWALLICQGRRIGLYLSDISGAFDKLCRCLLIGKLSQIGLPSTFLDFLNSYLRTREGHVRVEGALSETMYLCDMVFQGTVLGPRLWNAFFADVAEAVPIGGQEINLFADDLSVMTHAPQRIADNIILEELAEVQQRTHLWGRRNQVEFDPAKEHFNIIHPSRAYGEDFRLLGTLFDCRLTMLPCIEEMLSKMRPKMRAILRLRHIYSVAELLGQYKTHIWGISEYSNGAIIMACPSQLKRLDKAQRGFLRELGLTDTDAFMNYNFAPPSLRRCIGLLGFLHKRVIGQCHPALLSALPLAADLQANYHTKALHPFCELRQYNDRLFMRSLFAYILIYNRLPQVLVDTISVKNFQSKLTTLAKVRAQANRGDWRKCFQDCAEIHDMFYVHD